MATYTATPPKAARRLASIQYAADYLGVSPKTIRRHIAAGRLAGYRMGARLIRVDLNELDALLRPIPSARPTTGESTAGGGAGA